ncbi:MAG TPA: O-methyltransferase, partial [Tepidisphaeraceae bacterium]|nr:O-methyltransferase [Tepidisphaeraceae bacterium]
VTMSGAKSILEIGTLGGYSTIHLARALPAGGRVVTLEADARHADVAKANLARAGLTDVVDVWVGLALDTLAKLAADRATFDFVFIDADKANNAAYVDWALRLTRPGGVVVVDNVIRDGHVADAASTDLSVQGTRRMFDLIKSDPRVTATAVQTVGAKGYDGFVVAVVRPGA